MLRVSGSDVFARRHAENDARPTLHEISLCPKMWSFIHRTLPYVHRFTSRFQNPTDLSVFDTQRWVSAAKYGSNLRPSSKLSSSVHVGSIPAQTFGANGSGPARNYDSAPELVFSSLLRAAQAQGGEARTSIFSTRTHTQNAVVRFDGEIIIRMACRTSIDHKDSEAQLKSTR